LRNKLFLATALLVGSAAGAFADQHTPTVQDIFPTDVKQSCSIDQSMFKSNWTKLDIPSLFPSADPGMFKVGPAFDNDSGILYIFPPNGPKFPGTFSASKSYDNADNCDFFKWGSQMFLWLTSTVTDFTCESVDTDGVCRANGTKCARD